jgi:hypothetical protein
MVIIIILVSISLIFLYIGLMLLEKANRLKATGKKSMAIVIKNNFKEGDDNQSGMYHPVVQFLTRDNQLIIRELDFGSTSKRDLNTEIPIIQLGPKKFKSIPVYILFIYQCFLF